MEQYQYDFVEFLVNQEALLFGKFTLKSGRESPYFFNAGQFNTAYALSTLGKYYAQAIVRSNIEFDILFGPAYKGIPIAASVAIALYEQHGMDVPFCFNRKETKTHGEGGYLIGSPLAGKVLIVDDVISSGTTMKESATLIQHYPAQIVATITALDREERGETPLSALKEIETRYNIRSITIITLQHVIAYLQEKKNYQAIERIQAYQEQYGYKA